MADRKDVAMRFYKEVFDNGNVAIMDELLTPGFVEHETFPGLGNDRESAKRFITTMRDAFPDLTVTVEDMMEEGDRVAARIVFHGTHRGEFLGIPGTGRRMAVPSVDWVRFEGDKVAEHWGITDQLSMLEQLGVIPPAEGMP